jgi:hypothetical protein
LKPGSLPAQVAMMNEKLNTTGQWTRQPQAEAVLLKVLTTALEQCPEATTFSRLLRDRCGVRLRDIVDHISFDDATWHEELLAAGWAALPSGVLRHEKGHFPDFLPDPQGLGVAFRTAAVQHFIDVHGISAAIDGKAYGPYRRARVFSSRTARFWAVERNGHVTWEIPDTPDPLIRQARIHLQSFRSRRRQFTRVEQGLDHTWDLVNSAAEELGKHWACDLFFRAEREYFTGRCNAADFQHQRQLAAGIGWSNIDHHTYDSSREYYAQTINILETLGYECRELFYAGHQAGWGSQILEQPVLRSTIFADIDLSPDELDIDFSHMQLDPLPKARRAGLWCAMHGESMLEAGLNHVAGLYDQALLRKQLLVAGIRMMSPFSDYPELYQELTRGQWWPVNPKRIDLLQQQGHLSAEEAEDFRLQGAIGAHLENIERNDGFKGFNQPGIDGVLRIIDPRQNLGSQ